MMNMLKVFQRSVEIMYIHQIGASMRWVSFNVLQDQVLQDLEHHVSEDLGLVFLSSFDKGDILEMGQKSCEGQPLVAQVNQNYSPINMEEL